MYIALVNKKLNIMNNPFVAYFVGYNNNPQCQLADLAKTGIDVAILAFANLAEPNGIDMGNSSLTSCYTKRQLIDGIDAFHAQGKKVLLSINDNGGKGPLLWKDVDAATFVQNLAAIVKEWGFDGVDIDNEDVTFSPSQNFTALINATRAHFPTSFIISLPVYGGNEYLLNLSEIKESISYLFTMNYWGDYPTIKSYIKQLQTIVGSNVDIIPGVATPLAAGNQYTEISIVTTLAKSRKGMMLWAANYADATSYTNAILNAKKEKNIV